jgi:hypothetical protein
MQPSVIRTTQAGNVTETHEHKGDFKSCEGLLAPAGAAAELCGQADGESSHKLCRIWDGRFFSCVSDANSVKSANHV